MKKDKGFELIYWNLSYRRKFIRTMWMISLIIPSTLCIWYASRSKRLTVAYLVLIVATEIAQAMYTYKKWKNGDDDTCIK